MLKQLQVDGARAMTATTRPTVILLHTGGTISAEPSLEEGERFQSQVIDSPYHERLQLISSEMTRRYNAFYDRRTEPRFDLRWEVLSPQFQIFSENSTPEHWNALITKIEDLVLEYEHGQRSQSTRLSGRIVRLFQERRRDFATHTRGNQLNEHQYIDLFCHRDIAGIIVLHGTDTLAYAAAALALALEGLPFPVILTGSNQPFNEHALQRDKRSDAWRNILRSLHFLRCFGHRIAEVFACFGDTVHSGLNLRKVPINESPLPLLNRSEKSNEEFDFRTVGGRRRYLFRFIGGVFCNNYYGLNEERQIEALASDTLSEWAHISSPWFRRASKASRCYQCCDKVVYVKLSPGHPRIDVRDLIQMKRQGVCVVLVEGYESATYPTIERHEFARFLDEAEILGVVISIVSQHGLDEGHGGYAVSDIRDKTTGQERQVRPLTLYRVVPETALPLLSIVLNRIPPDTWFRVPKNKRPYEYRLQLLRNALHRFYTERKNLFFREIGNVVDERAENGFPDVPYEPFLETLREDQAGPIDLKLHVHIDGKRVKNRFLLPPDQQVATVFREEFFWSLAHEVSPYEKAGCAPDAFAHQYERGFLFGGRVYSYLAALDTYREIESPETLFIELSQDEQKVRLNRARKLLNRFRFVVWNNGVSDLHNGELTCQPAIEGNSEPAARRTPVLKLELHVTKHDISSLSENELYCVRGIHDEEEAFLDRLEAEARTDPEAREALAREYQRLNRTTWRAKSGPLDWRIAGYGKATMCGIARFLRFDEWSNRCRTDWQPGNQRRFRRAIRMQFVRSDERALVLRYIYVGVDPD